MILGIGIKFAQILNATTFYCHFECIYILLSFQKLVFLLSLFLSLTIGHPDHLILLVTVCAHTNRKIVLKQHRVFI